MRARRGTGTGALAAVGTMLVVAVLLSATVAFGGQFAGERFAPVLSRADEAALDLDALTIEPAGGSDVTFVVTFREPFEPPPDGYRVSVSVGDPTAKRSRWNLEMVDGAPVGTAESGDGSTWEPIGPVVAELDPAGGRARIAAQPSDVPPGSAIWVDVEVPTPLGVVGETTPYFPYDALHPAAPAGPTASWGTARDAEGVPLPNPVRVAGAPPSVTLVDGAIVVTAPDEPPTLLLGQPVTAAADQVRLLVAPREGGPPVEAGYVLVDRVTGGVQVFRLVDATADELPDAAATVVRADPAAAAQPPAVRSVSIDLSRLAGPLGVPDDPTTVAVAVDRTFTLADGSVVTVPGVGRSLAALAPAPAPDAQASPIADDVVVPVEADDDDGVSLTLVLVAAALAVVALVAAVVVTVSGRRRRRRESLIAEGWLDGEMTLRVPPGPPAAAEPRPATTDASAAGDAPAETGAPAESGAPAATDDVVIDLDALEASGTGNGRGEREAYVRHARSGKEAEESVDRAEARATQEQALADLEAQFADLIARVDRLGSRNRGDA